MPDMQELPDIHGAAEALASFAGAQLTERISDLEAQFQGADQASLSSLLTSATISRELLGSAYLLKRVAGQINVVIHAVGILLTLPHLMVSGERIEYLSLGAGNTGKAFDLETTERVAEFKFIHWQGGSEVIRQNALFKDFYLMAENESKKKKYMYVLGTEHPLRFLNGGRSLSSVMSRHRKLWDDFTRRYRDRFPTVRDYYAFRRDAVAVVDISSLLTELDGLETPDDTDL
jgi:hypothetical protein